MQLRWMMFVDGENFTIRGQEFATKNGIALVPGKFWRRDSYLWFPREGFDPPKADVPNHLNAFSFLQAGVPLESHGIRCSYYTSVQGDSNCLNDVKAALWDLGFDPHVFKKPQGRASKGVDITLTRDVLSNAFRGNFEVLVLVAGDADYVPLVEEVKRLGKRVHVVFWGPDDGLSPQLSLSADSMSDDALRGHFERGWMYLNNWLNRNR